MNFGAMILEDNVPETCRDRVGSIETRVSCDDPKWRVAGLTRLRMTPGHRPQNCHSYDDRAGYPVRELPKHGEIIVPG